MRTGQRTGSGNQPGAGAAIGAARADHGSINRRLSAVNQEWAGGAAPPTSPRWLSGLPPVSSLQLNSRPSTVEPRWENWSRIALRAFWPLPPLWLESATGQAVE